MHVCDICGGEIKNLQRHRGSHTITSWTHVNYVPPSTMHTPKPAIYINQQGRALRRRKQ